MELRETSSLPEDKPPINFINFGCWNKYGCKEKTGWFHVSNLIETLADDVDFIIVNGDNYYQDKNKDKETKDKTINNDDLTNGFKCLIKSSKYKEIFLLMGNHDIEPALDCQTIEQEKTSIDKTPKIHFPDNLTMFKELHEQDTLIIMIDSNIYTNENLSCYKKIIEDLPQDDNKIKGFLQEKQLRLIEDQLKEKKFTNIIICAHHPLIGFKNQIIKKGKIKGGIDTYQRELYELLYNTIRPHASNFFYLCSDIHNYQKGIVTIKNTDSTDSTGSTDSTENMVIHQYISGTGGADLDDDYNGNYTENFIDDANFNAAAKVSNANLTIENISIDYEILEHHSQHGIMMVNIKDKDIKFTFKKIEPSIKGGIKKKNYSYFPEKKSKTRKYIKTRGSKNKNKNKKTTKIYKY